MRAIQVRRPGGPEALEPVQLRDPAPGPGEVLVRHRGIGVNFIDVYYRTGLYPAKAPIIPGMEAAGVVEAVGEGAREFGVGDRVAYATEMGSYAELAAVPEGRLVPVPEGVTDDAAAAALLQGMTAHYLTHATFQVRPGQVALVHAGAGGVGLLLTQVLRSLGARPITTVSTPEKAALSRAAGAEHVILYTEQDFEAEVLQLTAGEGVDVVYDSVGRTTFEKGFRVLKTRGFMVLYGQSSGPVAPLDLGPIAKGSLFVTRPRLFAYVPDTAALRDRAAAVYDWIAKGRLEVRIGGGYPLAEAARAHRDLEGRVTTGKLLLVP